MQATMPYVDVPGDNGQDTHYYPGTDKPIRERIMGRDGRMVGMNAREVVWAFGFGRHSDKALAFGVRLPEDHPLPMWVRATRRTGKVLEIVPNSAFVNLPDNFKKVVEG